MAFNIDTNPEELAKRLVKSIEKDLQELIHAELQKLITPAITELARDLAKGTVVQMSAYRDPGFGVAPTINVSLMVNNKSVPV